MEKQRDKHADEMEKKRKNEMDKNALARIRQRE